MCLSVPAYILRQAIYQHLGDAAAPGKGAGLVHHIRKVLWAHGKLFIPLEFFDAFRGGLETGVGSAGYEEGNGNPVGAQLCVQAPGKGVEAGLGGGVDGPSGP